MSFFPRFPMRRGHLEKIMLIPEFSRIRTLQKGACVIPTTPSQAANQIREGAGPVTLLDVKTVEKLVPACTSIHNSMICQIKITKRKLRHTGPSYNSSWGYVVTKKKNLTKKPACSVPFPSTNQRLKVTYYRCECD